MKKHFGLRLQSVILCLIILLSVPFYCGIAVSAEDIKIDSDVLEDAYTTTIPELQIGETIDPDKSYEYVESTLFKEAGQEMWNMTKRGDFTATAGQTVSGHSAVKLTTSSVNTTSEIYFWNDKASGGRTPFGPLFGSVETDGYNGISLWISKPKSNKATKINVFIGSMFRGYWPNSKVGFYTYSLSLPKGEFEGYVHLPFSGFVNTAGTVYNSSTKPNFIGFRYPTNQNYTAELYVGELSLYREGTAGKTDAGLINIGRGYELDADKEYMFYDAIDFNKADDAVWARGKNIGFTVETGITDSDFVPEGADSSVKLSTDGTGGYAELYYWNERNVTDRTTNGMLFGTRININYFDGLRLWLKAPENESYSTVTIILGRMGTGYWPSSAVGFFTYTVTIYGGFEGYVNIPFENFLNNQRTSIPVYDYNFIAFKYAESGKATDLYVSDLQIYGEKNSNAYNTKPVGVQLDTTKDYELLPSLTFADASQKMWNETKIAGMTVTPKITDAEYIPSKGKTSINIHTDGTVPSPNVYYWNEKNSDDRVSHGLLFGDVDCTEYEGIRFWLKIAPENTYSTLTMYLGQMGKGYWPNNATGFFEYVINIPDGGFEGYVNIPFALFENKKGEALYKELLNFLGFKYNEAGLKVTDFWISDLSLYRVAVSGQKPSDESIIIPGKDLQDAAGDIILADGTVTDDIGDKYSGELKKTEEMKTQSEKNKNSGFSIWWIVIPVIAVVALALIFFIFILIKKRKNGQAQL
ncbi:MAG: hypothetical protein IKD04_06595 [Clostridia bacterium]|nr:hypothetical protein [Clostridia bacterium]